MVGCVLFVGNGPNNITNGYTWQDLISDLIAFIGARGLIDANDKPFPLLYEEIIAKSLRGGRKTELEVKSYISEKLRIFEKNPIHDRLATSSVKHLVTTNYDYTIENAIMDNGTSPTHDSVINESLYSLFRAASFKDRKVWHAHGECNSPSTVTLGYEHYAGYLQRMRAYVVTGTGTTYKNHRFSSIVTRLRAGTVKFESWVDYFFTKDIYIVGYTMDFVEIDLWWLITYRARCIYEKKVVINNQITYYYPETYAPAIGAKLQLLESSGVNPYSFPYSLRNKTDYYNRVLDHIESKCL